MEFMKLFGDRSAMEAIADYQMELEDNRKAVALTKDGKLADGKTRKIVSGDPSVALIVSFRVVSCACNFPASLGSLRRTSKG